MTAPLRHLVCFGAGSAIAAAYLRLRAQQGGWRFTLVGRNPERLEEVASLLQPAPVVVYRQDLADRSFCADPAVAWLAVGSAPDEALIAFARLDNQQAPGRDAAIIAAQFDCNLTATALLAEALLPLLAPRQGRLVVIGSTAADRARPTNYAYGASKAGLDYFLDGLGYHARRSGVVLTQVKPGLTDSAMTRAAGRPRALMVAPEVVARDMLRGVDAGRRVLYSPWYWWPIMALTRRLPRALLAKVRV